MTRIYLDQALAAGAECELPEAAARHVAQVLRMAAGETLAIFDGRGTECTARIVEAGKRRVRVALDHCAVVDRESPLRITLAQCVSRGERMDYTLQKAVELGVSAIAPLLSVRSVVRLDEERWERKLEHWRGVIVAACEQSGRTVLPQLEPVRKLDSWLTTERSGLRLVLSPHADTPLRQQPAPAAGDTIILLVGPEGGLDDAELTLARRNGFSALRLGPRVLRTETAGVAALAVLQGLYGDLAG